MQITAFVAVDSENRTLLMKRPQEGLLGGMWEFPSVEGPALDSALAPVTHRFTHLLATYHPVVVEGPAVVASLAAAGWPERPPSRPTRVLPLAELAGHAVPVGQLKIAAHVMEIWGSRRT